MGCGLWDVGCGMWVLYDVRAVEVWGMGAVELWDMGVVVLWDAPTHVFLQFTHTHRFPQLLSGCAASSAIATLPSVCTIQYLTNLRSGPWPSCYESHAPPSSTHSWSFLVPLAAAAVTVVHTGLYMVFWKCEYACRRW